MSATVRQRQAATILCMDPSQVSVKRLAWAFGCAPKGSDEEIALYRALIAKVLDESRHAKEPA